MDLADLFQQSERLWAENERVRRKLNETLQQAWRSLSQQPDHQAVAREAEPVDERQDDGKRPKASSGADSGH